MCLCVLVARNETSKVALHASITAKSDGSIWVIALFYFALFCLVSTSSPSSLSRKLIRGLKSKSDFFFFMGARRQCMSARFHQPLPSWHELALAVANHKGCSKAPPRMEGVERGGEGRGEGKPEHFPRSKPYSLLEVHHQKFSYSIWKRPPLRQFLWCPRLHSLQTKHKGIQCRGKPKHTRSCRTRRRPPLNDLLRRFRLF